MMQENGRGAILAIVTPKTTDIAPDDENCKAFICQICGELTGR